MSSQGQIMRYTRARSRKRMLSVDLNAVPPCEIRDHEGPSNHTRSQNRQATQEPDATLPPPIDLDAFDDDVIISSPRAFAEAKNNSRRNRGRTIVVDVDSEERSSRNRRRRVPTNPTIINCDFYINLEGSSNSTRKSGQSTGMPPAPPPPPKEEPTFSCPVCMGPFVEEVSTKCGHIFCKACIKSAIAAQSKCPTCRRRTTAKDLIRVYLPATRSA
ncbi:putative E3 ubiquitin ligase [Handroanthus impetiginosus]|uniref:Putative E3 ubiquitin ligase n=1 Tax=Handroanthus impetiginosus TaxID=429701 RepID=A0A2G9I8V1_9LAMI|nr:putative E3 ubiquitin ligase [Handroanthus impetiginosus]